MNTAKQVDQIIADLKGSGIPLSDAAWQTALACIGWPYIFGDRGQYCTPAHRRAAYNSKGAEHPTIKTKCKNFDGSGSCSGCTFYPGGQTRANDCRGFTYWVLLMVYGWKLMGAGATSQWNTASNWKAKGEIGSMPKNTLCCLFVQKGKTMEHTGFGLNNETIECSNGVQYFAQRKAKWTHWAVPAVVEIGEASSKQGGEAVDQGDGFPTNPGWRSTIRKGSKGAEVRECQTMLQRLGYDLGTCGVDGDYGSMTRLAVISFQRDHGLVEDGVCGPMTWEALDKAIAMAEGEPAEQIYTVTVTGISKAQGDQIAASYPGKTVIAEGGEKA
jgi:hypothetical protein